LYLRTRITRFGTLHANSHFHKP